MGVMVRGITVESLSISKDDNGMQKIEGRYNLISVNDTVLAKQGFNGYSEIKVNFSAETLSALNAFLAGVKKEIITTVLGE